MTQKEVEMLEIQMTSFSSLCVMSELWISNLEQSETS
jgi:hypothetical protein